jgi:hypothetical protein
MKRLRRMAVAALAAAAVSARAANDHPLDVSLRQYAFVLGIALLGGIVSFYAKVMAGRVHAWNVFHLVGEMATSAFAGLLAFWLCEWSGTPPLLTAALVGISGHMGARAISGFEAWAQRKFGQT